ncbi:hypothetical protein [Halorussus lipolyticus]|uniref:hypothetical protein n=1 Tax=Halorussus lipolyticus TaxID=3034024 RepID=UPI0023E78871|nr:hypothetical protein [Halorussus sp. DT80]
MTENKKKSRRKILKQLGVATTVTGFAGVGSAKGKSGRSQPEIFDHSVELKGKNGWNASEWGEYLKQHGITHESSSTTVSIPKKTTDGDVGTQKFDRNDVTFEISRGDVTKNRDFCYEYIHLGWNHSAGDVAEWGEAPPDTAAIGFHNDHYDRSYCDSEWVYYTDDSGNVSDVDGVDSKNPNSGAVCEWADGGYLNGDTEAGFGVKLNPKDGYSPSERELEFDYYHTYSDVELQGISFSFPAGVGVTYGDTTKVWDVERSFTASQIGNQKTFSP